MSAPVFTFDLDLDAVRLQRRPNHRHVVVQHSGGLAVFDPWTGAAMVRAPFCAEYPPTGIVDGWALRADGTLAIVFNDEERLGCSISLATGAARAVAHPPWEHTAGMPYDWRGNTLWMHDEKTFSFAMLTEAMELRECDGTAALQQNRAWRRALDRLRRLGGGCLRVEPERAQALFVATRERGGPDIGCVSWVDGPEPLLSVPDRVGGMAAAGERFIALYEYEALLLDAAGQVSQRFPAPSGFHHVDLDTLPAAEGRPGALIVAASALDGRILTRVSVYSLG